MGIFVNPSSLCFLFLIVWIRIPKVVEYGSRLDPDPQYWSESLDLIGQNLVFQKYCRVHRVPAQSQPGTTITQTVGTVGRAIQMKQKMHVSGKSSEN